jgi:hypothetical protein
MSGATPPFPNTPSWRGAELKKSTETGLLLPLPSKIEVYAYKFNRRTAYRTNTFTFVKNIGGIDAYINDKRFSKLCNFITVLISVKIRLDFHH